MPILRKAEREALKASIERWGVICPVVYDQTGELLDGQNRTEIATALGLDVPRTVVECAPEERDALRIELNTARRQITAEQWQPLVDHLRSLGLYSDRVIAKAIGVDRNSVQRYQSRESATDSPESVALSLGEDGKLRPRRAPEESTRERIVRLVGTSTKGLSAGELAIDGFASERTIHMAMLKLRKDGIIESAGKRGRSTIYRLADEPRPQPKPSLLDAKVDRVKELLADAEVNTRIREDVESSKRARMARKTANAMFAEDERRAVETQREAQRQLSALIESIGIGTSYGDAVTKILSQTAQVLANYCGDEFDDLPTLRAQQIREYEVAREALLAALDELDTKIRSAIVPQNGKRTFIDV